MRRRRGGDPLVPGVGAAPEGVVDEEVAAQDARWQGHAHGLLESPAAHALELRGPELWCGSRGCLERWPAGQEDRSDG